MFYVEAEHQYVVLHEKDTMQKYYVVEGEPGQTIFKVTHFVCHENRQSAIDVDIREFMALKNIAHF